MSKLIAPPSSSLRSKTRRIKQRSHTAAIVSRVLPLLVLIGGSLWMMEVMAQAPAGNQAPSANSSIPAFENPNGERPSPAMGAASIPDLPVDSSTSREATPEDPAVDSAEGQQQGSLLAKITQGGILMIPLGMCSLVVAALSIEKLISLRRSRVIPRPFVRRFTEFVEDGQLSYDEATRLCDEFNCPVAEVFQAAVRRWGRPMLEIEQAVMDAGDRVADSLNRFVRVFHAISNVAPLIGLLGTVLGMIESFEMMSSRESLGRPEMLASGISTALVTTAGGLMVAIPAYLAFMYFGGKSDRYLHDIDKLCQRVIECISAEGMEKRNAEGKSTNRRAA